ncbi:MAG: DUF3990 domain-containing protein [Muribaculaceae bacterium]|nr:DUF3990 domain-containing protein [Muribaculaceae bacterium]
MILYHGSLEIVESPEVREPNRTLDYGAGFYLTSSAEQAADWVKRKLKNGATRGYVNVYEYNHALESGLSVLEFKNPTEDWLDFVMANRMDKSFTHNYDIVKGPVANDRVYASFALYEAGLLGKQELISELKAYKLVNQVLLHTAASLKSIAFIKANEVLKK